MINYNEIDWKLLRKQKLHLLQVVTFLEHTAYTKQHREWAESLDGLVNLIDYIQDSAEMTGEYTEEEIFGKKDADGFYIVED